jgi:hypothetical protein
MAGLLKGLDQAFCFWGLPWPLLMGSATLAVPDRVMARTSP